jgi:mevalonate kinase
MHLPQLSWHQRLPWSELRTYARGRRAAWRRYADDPSPEAFAAVRGENPSHLVCIGLGEAADGLGLEEPPPLRVTLTSAIPLGSGFGSSAAAAAALLHAFFTALGEAPSLQRLEPLALEVERRQHGNPSGVDTATVLHGGLGWARRRENGVERRPLPVAEGVLEGLRVFDSGPPAEDTGTAVEAVRQLRQREGAAFEARLQRMEDFTGAFCRALASGDQAVLLQAMSGFQRCLEELGVVPGGVREIVRAVERQGGAAKISGAGSLGGPGAGSLLVYHPQPAGMSSWPCLSALTAYPVSLGAEGVRAEPWPPADNRSHHEDSRA